MHHFKSIGEFKLLQSCSPGTPEFRSKSDIFRPCDLEIWWMTLKNNRAPFLCYVKLCATFQNHPWIQAWVTASKRSIRVKISDSLSRVTLKFNGGPWKTIRHLLYTTPSFVHHSKAIGEWWIQTRVTVRKRSIRAKIGDFLSRATLKFDRWPWKTIRLLFYTTSSFVHHFVAIGDIKLELQSGNAQLGVKIDDFLSRVTLKFDGWFWIIVHLFFASSSFVHHFVAIAEIKLVLQSGNVQFGSKSTIF